MHQVEIVWITPLFDSSDVKQISWKKSNKFYPYYQDHAYITVGLLYMASFVETIKNYSEIPVTSNILQGNYNIYLWLHCPH